MISMEPKSANRRIARNTVMLYIRMIVSIVISLYTSRIILKVLGVEDYGIYGVVGGVVGMMEFLKASMSGATSRFITFELRDGNENQLSSTFNAAMIIHIFMAIIVLILAETIGLWFLNNKLVIPAESMQTANWVYQISVVASMISITQTPYMASITAHEKMDVYAYVEIVNVSLKLVLVILLQAIPGNKLLLYSILVLAVTTIVAMIYRVYAIRKFAECRFQWEADRRIIKPMLSFSFADIYGNLCGMSFYQGTAFIINIFFGVAVNAGNSIANTVAGLLTGLSNNVTAAYRPHIIKQYAAGDYAGMSSSMRMGSIIVLILSGLVCVPFFIYMPYILQLWLGQEPPYAVVFCRLLIIFCMMGQLNQYLVLAIHATGNIKWLSFGGGSLYLLTLPAMYIVFKMGMQPAAAYVVHIIDRIFIIALNVWIIHKLIKAIDLYTVIKSGVTAGLLIALCGLFSYWLSLSLPFNMLGVCVIVIFNLCILSASSLYFLFKPSERAFVLNKVRAVVLRT